MIIAYVKKEKFSAYQINNDNLSLVNEALWLDLISPTKLEESQIEEILGVDIPTREDMVEIELSSRLYKENDTLFMTTGMIAQSDTVNPVLDPVSFVLTPKQLITIRYIEPQSFKLFISNLKKVGAIHSIASSFLIDLLDAHVDRLADILEFLGKRLDEYSKTIFAANHNTVKLNYHQLMHQIGVNGDLNTKARESLVTFNRLITFFSLTADATIDNAEKQRLATLAKDIASLSDHANFLSAKVNFLLDATLGLVNIEQNNIIKIFSVAAVIFLPPTLIASIYGMNFHFIPELSWKYGYLFAISLILIAAWLPYKYFKYKKWL